MIDLIRREDVIALWDEYHPYIAVKAIEFGNALKEIPSAEPKHGKWIPRIGLKHPDWFTCSECTGQFDYKWNYCPNCGADMREFN